MQPVDLLPFRIQDVRRQLELEGDLTFEALSLLRTAEDERREVLEKCRYEINRTEPVLAYIVICTLLLLIGAKPLFFLRSIRQELISKNKVESSQEDEEQENHQENISVTTTDSGKGNVRISI